jgi:hypothetical protein
MTRPESPDQTEEILSRHLDSDFTVFPMADRRATTKHLDALSTSLGVRFPREFRAHILGQFPGIYVEVLFERETRELAERKARRVART